MGFGFVRPPGVEAEREEPWWIREDEGVDFIHEEVCDDPGLCSKCLGLGERTQKLRKQVMFAEGAARCAQR